MRYIMFFALLLASFQARAEEMPAPLHKGVYLTAMGGGAFFDNDSAVRMNNGGYLGGTVGYAFRNVLSKHYEYEGCEWVEFLTVRSQFRIEAEVSSQTSTFSVEWARDHFKIKTMAYMANFLNDLNFGGPITVYSGWGLGYSTTRMGKYSLSFEEGAFTFQPIFGAKYIFLEKWSVGLDCRILFQASNRSCGMIANKVGLTLTRMF